MAPADKIAEKPANANVEAHIVPGITPQICRLCFATQAKAYYGQAKMIELSAVLVLVAGLQVKHVICDGPLQTLRMVQEKSFYGRTQGLLHGLIHAVGTAVVLALWGLPVQTVVLLAVVDGVVHYHVDYLKENVVKANGWTTANAPFWWALTTDQTLHHMTYLLLVWFALKP